MLKLVLRAKLLTKYTPDDNPLNGRNMLGKF
jgi:hypothetical protein